MTLVLIGAGTRSLDRLPVDAYPDLSPPMVEIITQWPGHAAEEVERLITVPVEVGMNGIPQMTTQRSISLYGLSDVILTFDDGTDNNFARQEVFNRMSESQPAERRDAFGVAAVLAFGSDLSLRAAKPRPLADGTQDLRGLDHRTRNTNPSPGVADDSGFGGGTMQYQVLLDPAKIAGVGLSVPQVESALAANNGNAGGGFYSQGGQFYYVRGLGRMETLEDIGNVVLAVHNGTPVLVKDVGRVVIGIAPRLGEFGYEKQDDAVEGVILLRTGEKTQDVLKRVEAKTKELNEQILPKDVKVVPFYDRTRFDRADDAGRGAKSVARHVAGRRDPHFFPLRFPRGLDRRHHHPAGAAVRVHLSRSAKRLGQPALHRRGGFRHPGGWRGGDGGKHFPPDRRCARARRSTSWKSSRTPPRKWIARCSTRSR